MGDCCEDYGGINYPLAFLIRLSREKGRNVCGTVRRRAMLGRSQSLLRLRATGFAAALLDGCSTASRLPGNGGRAWPRKVRLTREVRSLPVPCVLVQRASGFRREWGGGCGCHSSAHGHGVLRAAERFALADRCHLPQPRGAVQWRTQMQVCLQMMRNPRGAEDETRLAAPSTASNQAASRL